jgi:hypothetical protein
MMHPNHKLKNTRLKLVKILTTNPNCEQILKCVFTLPDNQSSAISCNSKLSFHFNSLFTFCNQNSSNSSNKNNNKQKEPVLLTRSQSPNSVHISPVFISNNDREILLEFNQILLKAGLNYKTEYYSIINAYTRSVSSAFVSGYEPNFNGSNDLANFAAESTYLIVNTDSNWLRASVDLTTQFDKEFDDEILKIFHKSKQILNYFLEQCDRIVQELSGFAYDLTNKVVLMHSSVRKQLFQRLKSKLIKQYDMKQKWMYLIENMTHEQCLWFEGSSWPSFYILDQTESPFRERRRLRTSHLYIPERFFKPEVRSKLQNEKQTPSLNYLLKSYDDYVNASSKNKSEDKTDEENFEDGGSESTFSHNYMLNHWKYSENIK